ncbi:hypothetical protein [Streptomyces sp. TRM49041]|uniref:hypothetical protein n=1 Tax=Streptomyces sp. TRM49041 TaxID=2603216 RepID=UPI0011ECE9D4|nr:hypothetical protein [Streptomyces sp. TRM49041]
MDDNADQQLPTIDPAYAAGRLSKALATARTHEDGATRDRAEARAARWREVLAGIADGRLTIGSRTPVAGLPAWVTPEVLHGGFATGAPSAGGPLLPYETEAARRAGVPAERRALFAHFLSERGLTELWDLLDGGHYEVALPEEAALLTVAWLVRSGQLDAAAGLVRELEPFADRLRFAPRPCAQAAEPGTAAVHRYTVADVDGALARRRPHRAVEAQREALTVWAPFGDELLVHWLATADPDGIRVLGSEPDDAWYARGTELLRRYRLLAESHPLCGKHRDPKANLGILRGALEEAVAGRPLDARRLGLLRHAVASMVRRRGLPGSTPHTALRRKQAEQVAGASHQAMAELVRQRLAGLPRHTGVTDLAPLVAPVTPHEQTTTGLPAGAGVPTSIRHVVEAALSAPVGTLLERGVVPSAEVLAGLVPQLVAATTAHAYTDPALRRLMAAHYRAFRNRRSLLLLGLERQVRVEELPWVAAVARQRGADAGSDAAHTLLRELGELAVRSFPGTLLPNPLVRELSVLVRQADLRAPLVEELAADIFTGTFSPKFLNAARVAAELLSGSLYERYYGIDYAAVRNLAIIEASEALSRPSGVRTSPGFARLCAERAGVPTRSWSVAANGKVIEQAQILTTHNLATLVHLVGVRPASGWADVARGCFTTACRLMARAHRLPYPLPTIKDAAYAWRQMLFHLSLCTPDEQTAVRAAMDEELGRHPARIGSALGPALAGLDLVIAGGSFGRDGTADGARARRFLGWTTNGHWPHPRGSGRTGSCSCPA